MNIIQSSPQIIATKQCKSFLTFQSKIKSADSKNLESSKFNKLSKNDALKIGDFKLDKFNAIPVSWYKKFTEVNGKPDLMTITILAEIVYQYRALKLYHHLEDNLIIINKFDEEAWITSYQHFYDKFSFKTDTSRRSLRKLENLNIVKREVQNVKLKDGSRVNKLAIYLDRDFFFSCFVNPDTDIRFDTNDIQDKPLSSNSFATSNPVYTSSWQTCQDLISNKNIKNKNRSMKSNFILNDFEEKYVETTQTKATKENLFTEKASIEKSRASRTKKQEAKKLKDFYPLTEEDCSLLQSKSKRRFSLNAMNEILQDMSKKLLKPEFWSKKGFIAYMSDAFANELRNEVKISNENFRIQNNYTEIDKQEKFLSEIESSIQVTPEWQLKRKLAAMLERNTAYNFLLNYQYSERVGDTFKFYLTNEVNIRPMDKQIILNQVNAIQERVGLNGKIGYIENVEFVFENKWKPEKEKATCTNRETDYLAEIAKEAEKQKTPNWLVVRKSFIAAAYTKEQGIGLDKSWLSKLTAKEDKEGKKIILDSNNFVKDWVKSNYLFKFERIAKELGYEIELVGY